MMNKFATSIHVLCIPSSGAPAAISLFLPLFRPLLLVRNLGRLLDINIMRIRIAKMWFDSCVRKISVQPARDS